MVIDELLYTETHEWIKVDGKVATMGITDYAQKELGDIVYVELPEIDTELSAGDILATVEAVKAVEEIYIPISGIIIEVNEQLADASDLVNSSPYDEGWIAKFEISSTDELEGLMNAEEYKKLIGD
ncbi:MAG: glycine cleavage system protein GcvH [Candidatus Celaenobacter antarcticus]|nr:glycine cleavage system protein GcvH [Candidatus Celaenobacter antarcticus]MDP8313642.1 glycine cleavage system protein GcvH [Candidatus Celaenobacter antarcticus]MDP8313893.1 glycine cleavage system protein GcvH [Candidatus Celaenobacter antarcticus]